MLPKFRFHEGKVDGDVEARLVALCCSIPPEGYSRWSLRLLADKMVELEYIDKISHVAVGNVLDVYKRPYNPYNPVVCMDESPKQLIEMRNNKRGYGLAGTSQ